MRLTDFAGGSKKISVISSDITYETAEIAVKTVTEHLRGTTSLDLVRFVLYGEDGRVSIEDDLC